MCRVIGTTIVVLLLSAVRLWAHEQGQHQIAKAAPGADWATQHMTEEHHITGWDVETLFTLHDFQSTGHWSANDIRRMYGLFDQSTALIEEEHKLAVVEHVLDVYDADKDGLISRAELAAGWRRGIKLPDFGMGPGHHGDAEYEYEIHHWEKYHGDDTTLEDLIHSEDIEHFKMHEQQEAEEEEWAEQEKLALQGDGIIEANIPRKFLRTDL